MPFIFAIAILPELAAIRFTDVVNCVAATPTLRSFPSVHCRMFRKNSGKAISLSWPARKMLGLLALLLRQIGTGIVGIGFRPEHVKTIT